MWGEEDRSDCPVSGCCKTCAFSAKMEGLKKELRLCRFMPPTVMPNGQMARPVVHEDDWCGMHKAGSNGLIFLG